MTIETVRKAVLQLVDKYAICKAILFGSMAAGTNHETSDVDIIVEFSKPISLLVLSMLKEELEEMLGTKVDVIHGPITEDDMIEINDEVILYAA